jgi:hypothetical protein
MTLLLLLSGSSSGPLAEAAGNYRAAAPGTIIIARPGWFDQRMVEIAPPSCSWRTDGPGSFDTNIETRVLTTAGYDKTALVNPLKGKWLWWDHPTAGPWGGVITRTEPGQWTTRIVAEQFNVLLRHRRTATAERATGIAPGSLALYYLTGAERNGDSFLLTGMTAEEGGEAIDIEPRGGDLCDDIMPMLADYGYQWRVKASTMDERLFEFRSRLGTDKRGTVLLSEGRHITSARATGDLWTVANSIVGVSGEDDWRDANGYQLDDDGSIRRLGRRYEATVAYTGVATRSTIAPLVKRDLALRRYPQEIAEIQVVDEELCWSDVEEGDTISILSQHLNYHGPMEVDIRSLDSRSNVMTLAGRLLTEEA